jgi:hypothetical protein
MCTQSPTVDELLFARAEANGYRRGVHRELDQVRSREKHISTTKKNQDGTLRRYILRAHRVVGDDSTGLWQRADPAIPDGTLERRRRTRSSKACLRLTRRRFAVNISEQGPQLLTSQPRKTFCDSTPPPVNLGWTPNGPPWTLLTSLLNGSSPASPASRELKQMKRREVKCIM